MRATIPFAMVTVLASSALAQPGAPDQSQVPPPVQPDPYPPQGYYPQAPHYPVMQAQLTLDEQYLLEKGYISDSARVGGGLVSLFFGMGIGQAIQGRWTEKGYIFTIGELVTGTVFIWGFYDLFAHCFEGCSEARQDRAVWMLLGGLIGNTVFRIWDVVDAFQGPAEHNRKLRQLQLLGMPVPMYTRASPYVAPTGDGAGATAGFSLRF